MHGNLFVVSRLGQLRNVRSFIAEYGATGNHLAVLFTDGNLGLADAIHGYVEEGVFEEIVGVRQPERPLDQTRRKNRTVYRQIESLLVDMAEKGVTNLFLCNVDNYYAYFERVNERRGLGMTLNLLEEGLGTYANAGARRYVLRARVDAAEVAFRWKMLVRAAIHAAKALILFVAALLSWALRTDVAGAARRLYTRLTVAPEHRYGAIRRFDNAYVYFPERIHSANITIGAVHPLGFAHDMTATPETLQSVGPGATVFISQKYLLPEQYLPIVFQILDEEGERDVVFKFHPREDRSAMRREWDRALSGHADLRVSVPEAVQSVPVEELMMAGRVSHVIGLTSTSLMYAAAFFPGVRVTSIGSRFREVARSDRHRVSTAALAEFERDLEVFLEVSGVEQFAAPTDR